MHPTDDRASRSTFAIPAMDCPSEENMIRMALRDDAAVRSLSFDLGRRQLVALHHGPAQGILQRLEPLGLGARLMASVTVDEPLAAAIPDRAGEAGLLRIVLAINAAMFVIELGVGLLAESAGLLADSLDMFADAAVYGMALYAVGRGGAAQGRAARMAGWLQLVLAAGVLAEVGRRWVYGSEPASLLMMAMGLLALAANAACLVLVAKKRDAGVHMRASYIFTANDVVANAGVIAAGLLVSLTGSRYPDLVIGAVIGAVVLNGARRILRLR